ncbi:hypothetical protein ABZ858_03750 [Streptomyces sp. NPDC047017]|uniref:hypothetical protein n=1 Tax=Streptomyces sp. NPDC047017 TaxID=3155024 RepID=UPI00340A37DE
MEKRLEAGWFQRIAWVALAWLSLGMLMWVPFLYVAIRRGRGSDWGAFVSFALYECVTVVWMTVMPDQSDDDALFGLVIIGCMLVAALMLLFGVFDRRTARAAGGRPYGAPQAPVPGQQPYGYPYGR